MLLLRSCLRDNSAADSCPADACARTDTQLRGLTGATVEAEKAAPQSDGNGRDRVSLWPHLVCEGTIDECTPHSMHTFAALGGCVNHTTLDPGLHRVRHCVCACVGSLDRCLVWQNWQER